MKLKEINDFNISMIDMWLFITDINSFGELFDFVNNSVLNKELYTWYLNKKGFKLFSTEKLFINIVDKKEDIRRFLHLSANDDKENCIIEIEILLETTSDGTEISIDFDYKKDLNGLNGFFFKRYIKKELKRLLLKIRDENMK